MWNEDKEDYKREVQNFGYLGFEKNDQTIYDYFDDEQFYPKVKVLNIYTEVGENLNGFFNNLWIPVFVKWFEHNTGLDVDSLRYQGKTLYSK